MIRLIGWLCVAVLAIGAHVYDNDWLRAATAFAAIGLIALFAPASLRIALAAIALVAAGVLAAFGTNLLLDALPAMIAAFVANAKATRPPEPASPAVESGAAGSA